MNIAYIIISGCAGTCNAQPLVRNFPSATSFSQSSPRGTPSAHNISAHTFCRAKPSLHSTARGQLSVRDISVWDPRAQFPACAILLVAFPRAAFRVQLPAHHCNPHVQLPRAPLPRATLPRATCTRTTSSRTAYRAQLSRGSFLRAASHGDAKGRSPWHPKGDPGEGGGGQPPSGVPGEPGGGPRGRFPQRHPRGRTPGGPWG